MPDKKPENKPDVLSIRASSLSAWNDCPRRAMARHYPDIIEEVTGIEILREERRFVSSAVGTCIHRGAQTILSMKMKGETATLDDMLGASMASYADETENGIEYDKTTAAPTVAEQQIRIIANEYFTQVFPRIEPIYVEASLSAVLNKGANTELSGHPDVIEADRIRDIKTGKSGHNYHAQLGAYALLANAIGQPLPSSMAVDHLPRKTPNKPYPGVAIFVYETGVCVAEARAVIKTIINQVSEFRETKLPEVIPVNSSSILCSDKYCPAYNTEFCKLFHSETTHPQE